LLNELVIPVDTDIHIATCINVTISCIHICSASGSLTVASLKKEGRTF